MEELAPYRQRLEKLKEELAEKRGDAKGCGIGCLTIGAGLVFMVLNGFSNRVSWAVLVGAFVIASVVFMSLNSKTTPEERALQKEIDELEKFIARSEQQRR